MISPQEAGSPARSSTLSVEFSREEVAITLACLSLYEVSAPCMYGSQDCKGGVVCPECTEAYRLAVIIKELSKRIKEAWSNSE